MSNQTLPDCVRANIEAYFSDLDGTEPANMHDMLMRAVEKPLLEVVMAQAQHNQSRAAQWLGSPTAHREAETAKAHRG